MSISKQKAVHKIKLFGALTASGNYIFSTGNATNPVADMILEVPRSMIKRRKFIKIAVTPLLQTQQGEVKANDTDR